MLAVVAEVATSLVTMTELNRATVFIGLSIASVATARLVLDIVHYKEVMGHYETDLALQQTQTEHLEG
jgi:hypothetical protein